MKRFRLSLSWFLAGAFFGMFVFSEVMSLGQVTRVWMTKDGKYIDIQKESWIFNNVQRNYSRKILEIETLKIVDELPEGTTTYVQASHSYWFSEPDFKRIFHRIR